MTTTTTAASKTTTATSTTATTTPNTSARHRSRTSCPPQRTMHVKYVPGLPASVARACSPKIRNHDLVDLPCETCLALPCVSRSNNSTLLVLAALHRTCTRSTKFVGKRAAQNLARPGPHKFRACRVSSQSGPSILMPRDGRIRAKVGRKTKRLRHTHTHIVPRIGPRLARIQPKYTFKIDHHRPSFAEIGQNRPVMAKLGQSSPKTRQSRPVLTPESTEFRPTLAKNRTSSTKTNWADFHKVSMLGPVSACTSPKLARNRLGVTRTWTALRVRQTRPHTNLDKPDVHRAAGGPGKGR